VCGGGGGSETWLLVRLLVRVADMATGSWVGYALVDSRLSSTVERVRLDNVRCDLQRYAYRQVGRHVLV
jgi:hypothetical protein